MLLLANINAARCNFYKLRFSSPRKTFPHRLNGSFPHINNSFCSSPPDLVKGIFHLALRINFVKKYAERTGSRDKSLIPTKFLRINGLLRLILGKPVKSVPLLTGLPSRITKIPHSRRSFFELHRKNYSQLTRNCGNSPSNTRISFYHPQIQV